MSIKNQIWAQKLKDALDKYNIVVTDIGDPGSDDYLATEQAIREAINEITDKTVKATWFDTAGSGTTSGTVSKPAGGGDDVSFVMDEWGSDTDALVSKMANGRPTWETPVDSGGNDITTTFNLAGEYSFSGTPSPAGDHAVIFVYKAYLKNFDADESMFESELVPAQPGSDHDIADHADTSTTGTQLDDWLDQAVKAASSPALAGLTVAGSIVEKLLAAYNGIIVEELDALVTSAAGVVTLSVEQANGGGDLTMSFSDGFTTLDCTPADTITLTAGSDAAPTENYIYIPKATKVLTKSTSDWPSAEHIRIGFFFVPSATYVENNGTYVNQNWNNDTADTALQGHNSHMGERLRLQSAIWKKGAAATISTNGTVVDLAIDSGVVWQMHRHVTPSFDTTNGDLVLVVNQHANNGGAYGAVSDLENLTNDTNDVAFKKYFNWVIWGVVNKSGEYVPVMLNLPTGSYNKESDANADISGYDVLTMPAAFNTDSSTGFLIARVTMELSGGAWAVKSAVDLRGSTPQSVVGGGVSAAPTEFADNQFKIFDESDVTKLLDFQLSGIASGNTRTLTIPDENGIIALFNTAAILGTM